MILVFHSSLIGEGDISRMRLLSVALAVLLGIAGPLLADDPGVRDRIVYGVAPVLLGPDGFDAAIARLDGIAALGVDTVWLTPVGEAPAGDFGYAASALTSVRDSLGGAARLRALVAAAHDRGLRVVLDIVVNHLGDRHPLARDAAVRGPDSPAYGLFQRGSDGAVAHYFDWRNLDNLDYGRPEVRAMMIDAARYWVEAFGVDGFRVDAAWAVAERAPDFWPQWRDALAALRPGLLLIAEASARDPAWAAAGFDAAYDWTDRLGEWAWATAFDEPSRTPDRLRTAIDASGRTPVLRFLNNNDTGRRFVTRHGVARARLAAVLLLTLPGVPALFMGDEVGAAFEPYGAPEPFDWRDRHDLEAHYRRLIRLRRAEPALRDDGIVWLDLAAPTLLAYRRPGRAGSRDVVVLLNFGDTPERATIGPLREAFTLVDVLDGSILDADDGAFRIDVPALGWRILSPRGERP